MSPHVLLRTQAGNRSQSGEEAWGGEGEEKRGTRESSEKVLLQAEEKSVSSRTECSGPRKRSEEMMPPQPSAES